MGSTSNLPGLSIQRIRAYRYFGVAYRDRPTDEEIRIAKLGIKDYRHEIAVLERMSHYQGQSFKAPAGLPLTRSFDGTIYMRAATFNFSVQLDEVQQVEHPFTHHGVAVQRFRPVIWGSNTISSIREGDARLSFGTGEIRGNRVAFYKLSGRRETIQCVSAPLSPTMIGSTSDRGITIYYLNRIDASNLSMRHHKSTTPPVMAGIVGDDDAIYNYGMYCRSSHAHGFGIYRSLFESFKSTMPEFVRQHMPPYPKFARDSVAVDQARTTHFLGYNSIRKLRLVCAETTIPFVTIDLNGAEPRVVTPDVPEDEMSEEEFWEW
jgi:hypothetical protein